MGLSILFSEFSLSVTFVWYWPLSCHVKLVKPKYVAKEGGEGEGKFGKKWLRWRGGVTE